MKPLYFTLAVLSILVTSCSKDDVKPMTDKEFERNVNWYFANEWTVDVYDNQHESLNNKSEGLKGKIGATYAFEKNGTYSFVYDSLVSGNPRMVTETGNWVMDNANRKVHLHPKHVEMTDANGNTQNLNVNASRTYGIQYISWSKLYFTNYIKQLVTSINSEGVEVQELKDATETLYFVNNKDDKKDC